VLPEVVDGERFGECVFCTRRGQPSVLFETCSLYVMPDKFPTRPGHALIIAKEHLECYGAAPGVLSELEEAKGRVERFLRAMYPVERDGGETVGGASGGEAPPLKPTIYAMEHGVYGQTVFHAHLHVTPGPYLAIPPEYLAHPDVQSIDGWEAVIARYTERGQYRVVEYAGARYLVDGTSPSLALARPWFARFTGMSWRPEGGWQRNTSEEDVRELERRWRVWSGAGDGRAPARSV
jgi:diadenosine tetraphosphate (Ap4A) HIT family hydrolase